MNLAIDIGNTCAKLAVIENGQVVDFFKTDTLSEVYLEQLLENFPDITGAILISVHEDSDAPIEALLRRRLGRFIRFGSRCSRPDPQRLCDARYARCRPSGRRRRGGYALSG